MKYCKRAGDRLRRVNKLIISGLTTMGLYFLSASGIYASLENRLGFDAAPRCRTLTATDFSKEMLKRAERKYGKYPNIKFEQADIMRLGYPDASFDAVVAANVIHLLDAPYAALRELDRVCRPGGRLIIPTYMNQTERGTTNSVSGAIGRAGADFKREFTLDTYKQFFDDAGYPDASYTMCSGRIPCAVAVLRKGETHEGNDA